MFDFMIYVFKQLLLGLLVVGGFTCLLFIGASLAVGLMDIL